MDSVLVTAYNPQTKRSFVLSQCAALTFEKERYTPYTSLSGTFICNEEMGEISKVSAIINGTGVHYGPIDTARHYTRGGISYFTFTSRGFSMGLSQNHLEPGMRNGVGIKDLANEASAVPYVTYNVDSDTVNYIYIKDSFSLWDGIVAFCQKKSGEYPYIKGDNTVCSFPPDSTVYLINGASLLEAGRGSSYASVISHFHMKDTDDKYSYVYSSPSAAKRELVRHKYQNLDRQWFSDPVGGLKFKNMFSERGLNYFYVKIPGFNGADIRSRVSCEKTIDGEKFGTREVSKLRVSYSKKGMFTTMWFYTDGYTN